jgi:hypothetical protein
MNDMSGMNEVEGAMALDELATLAKQLAKDSSGIGERENLGAHGL